MKSIKLIMLAALITGCSTNNYISTSEYSDKLKVKCLETKASITDSDRTACALDAASQISMASRLYELREQDDLIKCKQVSTDQEKVGSCFRDAQKKFYDMHFIKK